MTATTDPRPGFPTGQHVARTPRRRHPFAAMLRAEFRLFLRDPAGPLWTAVLPITAVVVLGIVPGANDPSTELRGATYFEAYLPILMMFSLCASVVNALPPAIAAYRERGVLRRLSTTPVPPSRLLGAQAVIYVGMALLTAIVMLVISVAAFSIELPAQLPGFVLALLLVAAAVTGLAVLLAALVPNARVANGVALVAFFPLLFLAGLWLPRAAMPHPLRIASDYSPLGAGVGAVQRAVAGHFPTAGSLLVLAGWAIVLAVAGARAFRWE